MTMNQLEQSHFFEMTEKELAQINGGGLLDKIVSYVKGAAAEAQWWAVGALYIIWETAANPKASYEAFMKGWNATY